jgi:hypothetical protein
MERRRKVELFEELRREYEYGCGTIVGVAKTFGVHRRLVRQAIESALPPERKRAARRRPKFAAICEFIDQRLTRNRPVFIDVFYFVQENRKVKIGPEANALIH